MGTDFIDKRGHTIRVHYRGKVRSWYYFAAAIPALVVALSFFYPATITVGPEGMRSILAGLALIIAVLPFVLSRGVSTFDLNNRRFQHPSGEFPMEQIEAIYSVSDFRMVDRAMVKTEVLRIFVKGDVPFSAAINARKVESLGTSKSLILVDPGLTTSLQELGRELSGLTGIPFHDRTLSK